MTTLKKTILSFAIIVITVASYAQTTTIYGKVTKSDGGRIKGTSVMKMYEDQLIIVNLTGGSDNTATIEIEVPTSACIADFRSLIIAPPQQTVAAKPAGSNAVKPPGSVVPVAVSPVKITTQSLQTFPIARVDISVTNRTGNSMPTLLRQVIFENVVVESCTDIVASNTSKIKLKAKRIGWIYYSTDAKGNVKVSGKSGWDNTAGTAWTNF